MMKYIRNNNIRVYENGKIEYLCHGKWKLAVGKGKKGRFADETLFHCYTEAFLDTRRTYPLDGDWYNVCLGNVGHVRSKTYGGSPLYSAVDLWTGEEIVGKIWEMPFDRFRIMWALQTNNLVKHYYITKIK